MNFVFEQKGFFVERIDSGNRRVMMLLARFFENLQYIEIENYCVLYQDGLDNLKCLNDYLDRNINYYEFLIDNLSKPIAEQCLGALLPIYNEKYEKTLSELKKSKLRLTKQ
jgi:hypothetical protein